MGRSSWQNMTGHDIDVVWGTRHHVQVQQQLELSEWTRRGHATFLQHVRKTSQVGDESSGRFGAFTILPGQEEDVAVLIEIFNKRNEGERLPSSPTRSRRDVRRQLMRARMDVANDLLPRILIKDKPEVQLIAEKSRPRV